MALPRCASAFGALLLAVAAHSAEIGVTDKEILVGQNITIQGGKNSYGVAVGQGMRLQFDAINAAGGINGRKIVLRTLDDDNKSANAEANARKLIQEGAFLLFGSVEGGPSTAVLKVASEQKVPFFGPMAGPPALRRPHQPMVFPVRAEHREEFRALLAWGKNTGLSTVGFLHSDTDVGRAHLENVRLAASALGMTVVLALPVDGAPDDAQIDAMVRNITEKSPGMMLNHGASGLYTALVRKSKAAGAKTTFMGVNSGSYEIAKSLGPLAQGMVFSQVVPSPWERKREIAREYQDAARQAAPSPEFSYGALEGYMTAKALVLALRTAGRDLTRASLLKALENMRLDLGGVVVRYGPGDHEGSRFVDLSMVSRDGRFIH